MTEPESVFEFPCKFPIKIMGRNHPDLEITVVQIMNRHVPDLSENAIKSRPSKQGTYTAITVTINATSRAQLDNIYQELSAHELVMMAL